ncbi:Peptidase M28 [Macleaya cordata]|uniref:Vacuolar membrane protease n=1 Tax=Macleaya cordata TaxID=56857 RepID=A0A200QI00_MACCD|nr:Peptidase M28 [Macleaya cordata]
MPRRSGNSSSASKQSGSNEAVDLTKASERMDSRGTGERPKRSAFLWLALLVVIVYCSWAVYRYQFETLPRPLGVNEAGKRGFSEHQAMEHVKALTELGPHPVGSDALDLALQYVLAASEKIKKMAHWEVDVQVDFFHAESGSNNLVSGLFKGKTLVYSDLKHVVLRILPKYSSTAEENTILVSSHIDTVFSTEGAGDCSSCVAVMLELARGISQWAHGFKNAVIFLFNTGEEEGLNGAHSFITQHPWSSSVRLAIDLEAMGIGGQSSIFQAGPDSWAIENFAKVAKYPSGQIIAQDLFFSGVIKSATDFQIYKEVAGLSGLDFAYTDIGAVYHTKNDKLKLLKPGSLQHLGENMLAFLLQTATSSHLPKGKSVETDKDAGEEQAIFFDILGSYMVVYHQRLATMLQNSVLLQSLLIWTTSLFMGGYPAAVSLGLSFLSVLLMWIFSLGCSLLVAFLLPLICSSPAPYIASPWVVVGLFAAPAVLGALTGQHIGYLLLIKYLQSVFAKREQNRSSVVQADIIKLEAERWLFKSGFLQWLVVLMVGNFYKIGSSYMALLWLVSPAFAFGFLEATLSPVRAPKPLKIVTLLLGLALPILMSAGIFIRLTGTLTGIIVRLERNPGSTPEWLGNVMVAVFVATIVCLTLVYLLSYVHLSGPKRSVILATFALFGLTLAAVLAGIIPPFTEDIARAVNVVHVVETNGAHGETQTPSSYISMFSVTPGKLIEELEHVKEEGFVCGKEKVVDFVTFTVNYGCWSSDDTQSGWSESDIPTLNVKSDMKKDERVTEVSIDTKLSTRWALAINTEEIEDFKIEVNSEELVQIGNKNGVDGWHIIQFSGGKNAPTKFDLTLFRAKNSTRSTRNANGDRRDQNLLLKLRTDVNRWTPKAERVLKKLPKWCSMFGKSTSPQALAFLSSLPVDF